MTFVIQTDFFPDNFLMLRRMKQIAHPVQKKVGQIHPVPKKVGQQNVPNWGVDAGNIL